jgi:hypothetical protein
LLPLCVMPYETEPWRFTTPNWIESRLKLRDMVHFPYVYIH